MVSGDIYGSCNTGVGSSSGGAGNTIYNFGTVSGDIYAGDADDTVVIGEGAMMFDVIDGQDGYDILGFYNVGSFDPSVLSGYFYQNFESYGFVGGVATLNVDWDTGAYDLAVKDGRLDLAGGVILTTNGLYVYDGSLLGGNGLIVGHVINQGFISPGNSVGTLTINGDFTNNGGSLLVELGRGGGNLLRVSGTALINGGLLRASPSPDVYLGGESWTVLSADHIVGRFNGLDSGLNSATLSLSMTQSGNSVGVLLTRKPYADFAHDQVQAVMGSSLDAILPQARTRGGYMADLIMAMDFGYNAAQITGALQAFVPEVYPALAFAQLESAGLAADAVEARLDQARTGGEPAADTATTASGISVWARALGARTSQDASQGWPGHDHTWAGLIPGADYAFTPNSRLGLAVGYTASDLSWDKSSYIGDMETLHLLAYGGGQWNGFHAQASLGAAWHEGDAKRDFDFAGSSGKAQAEPKAFNYLAGVKAGYDFQVSGWRLGPLVGLRYIHLDQDGFRESGAGDLGLVIDSADTDSVVSTLGVSASTRWDFGGITLRPSLGLAWPHEFQDDAMGVTAWFQDYSEVPMVFSGQERPADRAVLDLGLSARLAERLDGAVAFSQAWGDGYLASGLSLSLEYLF